jgi:hypothetical protein
VYSSAELIEALRRRMRRSLRPERPAGEFPPGWSAWFAEMGERIGAVTGASADAIVDVVMQRAWALPAPATGSLNPWQAFATLWRQQWHPASREERWPRFVAYVITLLVHLVLAVMLVLLAYTSDDDETSGEMSDVAIRVQFIGRGTPTEEGGGPPSPAPDIVAAPPTTQVRSQQRPPVQRPELSEPQPPSSNVEAPPAEPLQRVQPQLAEQTVESSAEQALQVTETATPDETRFRLPPPQARAVDVPTAPSVAVPTLRSEVEAIPLPRTLTPVRPIDRAQPPRQISVPRLAEQPAEIELAQPLPAARARELPQAAAAPQLQVPVSTAEPQSLPMPPGASAAAETARAATQASGAPDVPPAPASGTQPSTTSTGAGAGPTPGAAPTPARADDWGDAKRNVAGQPRGGQQPGAKPGLYNADGSLRLPPGAVTEGPGQYGHPPGSEEQHVADVDRAGTWLARPRLGYEPTRFDKYWVPRESLLQEWVRKGLKKLSIPIPGTSKRLECIVSILQVGGACGLTDSEKLFDQPAEGRPAPDVPFKPELQEDQDSLKRP